MKRSICDWYSDCFESENMGELPHRYVLGLYELLERLTNDFPDVIFEGCSGGVLLPKTWGDYSPIELHLIRENAKRKTGF